MQVTVAALLAIAGTTFAQVDGFNVFSFPTEGSELTAGETVTITWSPAPEDVVEESVDIILLAGSSPTTLQPATELVAEGIDNAPGAFEWEIPADLGDDDVYGLKIQLSSDPDTFQFSFPFKIAPSENENGGEKPTGTKTGTVEPTETATETATEEEETSTDYTSATEVPTETLTSVVIPEPTASDEPEPTATDLPGSGAQANGASLALIGGLAIAAFAL